MADEIKQQLSEVASELKDNTKYSRHAERNTEQAMGLAHDIKARLDIHMARSEEAWKGFAANFERIRCIVEGVNGGNGLQQKVNWLMAQAKFAVTNSMGFRDWLMVAGTAVVGIVGIIQLFKK